jgi:hypothetical protein
MFAATELGDGLQESALKLVAEAKRMDGCRQPFPPDPAKRHRVPAFWDGPTPQGWPSLSTIKAGMFPANWLS